MGVMKKSLKLNFIIVIISLILLPDIVIGAKLTDNDLLNMSLTQLMSINVSSVSKKNEAISDAPGAIFVITQEDIRRSGVTSIPEALRMAPGVQVNRMDANKWAITIRGFNGRFANKLLVLMDGRTIYTPLFAGVFWEIQDYPLADIDRIEVIRGGSGTLWGANAFNGVINIITKKAEDTQGFLLSAGAGSEEKGFATMRYGNRIGKNIFYRVYGKAFSRDSFTLEKGGHGNDDYKMGHSGFRLDLVKSHSETLSLHGDYYNGDLGQTVSVPDFFSPSYAKTFDENADVQGENIVCRWQKKISETSDFDFHIYYDYTSRREYVFNDRRNTMDLDFQHRFSPFKNHSVLWGTGYRITADHITKSAEMTVKNNRQSDNLYSGFIQDEISFFNHHFRLIPGVRLEHNDYTGYEIEPGIRSIYTTDGEQTVWAALSRGVRTPSRLEQSVTFNQKVLPPGYLFPGSPASMAVMHGSSRYDSEDVLSYELGLRSRLSTRIFTDISFFYNHYDNMLSFRYGTPKPPLFNVPATIGNEVDGHSYGAELACTMDITEAWRLMATYSFMTMNLDANQSDSPVKQFFEDDIPRNQFSIRSWLNLSHHFEFDGWLRYTDPLKDYDIDNYFTLDLRIGWQFSKAIDISFVGQNLLHDHHREYGTSTLLNTQITEVDRGFYVKLNWRL